MVRDTRSGRAQVSGAPVQMVYTHRICRRRHPMFALTFARYGTFCSRASSSPQADIELLAVTNCQPHVNTLAVIKFRAFHEISRPYCF